MPLRIRLEIRLISVLYDDVEYTLKKKETIIYLEQKYHTG